MKFLEKRKVNVHDIHRRLKGILPSHTPTLRAIYDPETMFPDWNRAILQEAMAVTDKYDADTIDRIHVLIAILSSTQATAYKLISSVVDDPESFLDEITKDIQSGGTESGIRVFSGETSEIFTNALKERDKLGHPKVGSAHILLGVLEQIGDFSELLINAGVTYHKISEDILNQIEDISIDEY